MTTVLVGIGIALGAIVGAALAFKLLNAAIGYAIMRGLNW